MDDCMKAIIVIVGMFFLAANADKIAILISAMVKKIFSSLYFPFFGK